MVMKNYPILPLMHEHEVVKSIEVSDATFAPSTIRNKFEVLPIKTLFF